MTTKTIPKQLGIVFIYYIRFENEIKVEIKKSVAAAEGSADILFLYYLDEMKNPNALATKLNQKGSASWLVPSSKSFGSAFLKADG